MTEAAAAQTAPPSRPANSPLLFGYIALLGGAAVALGLHAAGSGLRPPGEPSVAALPFLGALLVAAEYLYIRFRAGTEINGLNLVEAALAPLLFAFGAPAAMVTVALAQLASAVLRRNVAVKGAFNLVQWTLATGVGAWVLARVAERPGINGVSVAGLLLALAVVGVVNQAAFTLVLAIANRQRVSSVLSGLGPVMVPGWVFGWIVNSMIGLLFVFAYAAHPAAVLLFAVPLVVLHLAYRGYAAARSDRVRLAGLHRAAQALAEPLDPNQAVAAYLREVAASFEARAAVLVLATGEGRSIHSVSGDGYSSTSEEAGTPSLAGLLLAQAVPVRVTAGGPEPVSRMLAAAGWRDCLAAPLMDDGRVTGALLVMDQAGFEGFEAGELAVLEALARETAATFAKGRLLATILEERRKLAEVVSTTSDGILTLGTDGVVRSWNPAMERITGLPAVEVVDRPGALARLRARTVDGEQIPLDRWPGESGLPDEVRITRPDGRPRRLSCSYSHATDDRGRLRTLVVVARDVTSQEEMEELREERDRLAEAEAVQRAVVGQLQQALMPARPHVAGAEFGVFHLASEPRSPTGGDLYDWQQLPDGHVHLAVVDVVGHGVGATKDAVSVVHTLRLLALEGHPLEDLIARADELLGAQNPDLVATAMVGRYDPSTGRVRLVSGGHPPALHISVEDGVRQIPAPGGAIGWPVAGSELVGETTLGPGDTLVLYTDGLVEARKDILSGTEDLVRHAQALMFLPAEDLAAALVERALDGEACRDDCLALVVRRSPAVQRARWRCAPDPAEASDARRSMGAWLRQTGLPEERVADLQLVAAELLSNGLKAARSAVELRVELENGRVRVEVEDDGPGQPGLERMGLRLPPPEADAGRGLFLVRTLSDALSVTSTFEGTAVRADLRITDGEEPSERRHRPGSATV